MGTYAEGKSLWVNLPKRVVLHHFSFKKKVDDLQFSPDGKYFAVTSGRHVQVWQTPPMRRETGAFVLHRTYTGHYDDVTCIDWSADGRYARVHRSDNVVLRWEGPLSVRFSGCAEFAFACRAGWE